MRELSLTREGYTSSYLGVPQELKVRLGDDVALVCSASSSEEPNYFWSRDVRKLRGSARWDVSSLCFWKLVILSPASSLLPSTVDVTSLFLVLSRSSLSWPTHYIQTLSDPLGVSGSQQGPGVRWRTNVTEGLRVRRVRKRSHGNDTSKWLETS